MKFLPDSYQRDILSEEDVRRITEMYKDSPNLFAHLKRARQLLASAKPGNFPWKLLERDYGFVSDYSPFDEYQADEPGTRH